MNETLTGQPSEFWNLGVARTDANATRKSVNPTCTRLKSLTLTEYPVVTLNGVWATTPTLAHSRQCLSVCLTHTHKARKFYHFRVDQSNFYSFFLWLFLQLCTILHIFKQTECDDSVRIKLTLLCCETHALVNSRQQICVPPHSINSL